MKYLLWLLPLLFSPATIAQTFPDDWLGNYEGEMHIGNVDSHRTDTIPVTLEFQTEIEDSAWSYKMTYNSEQFGMVVKDYKIRATKSGDTKKLLLDENNGIVMEMSLMNGTMYGMYEVLGTLFITTLKFEEEEEALYFDLFGASMSNPTETSTIEDGEEYKATSYRTQFHQSVLLRKVE